MSKTYEEVLALKNILRDEYLDRHEACRRLRKFWHGRYWENTESDRGGLASIFRDLTARQSDIGPDIKLTYNVLKDVCVKFQTYLSPLPMIRCYVDPPSTPTRRNQATTKERYLYGLWSATNATQILSDQGWFLPLMGSAYLGIYPDMDTSLCNMILRSPEYAFPLQKYDLFGEDGVIFSWKTKTSAAARHYPGWAPQNDGDQGRSVFSMSITGSRRPKVADPEVEILEYSDSNEFHRWVDGVQVAGVTHDFGFNLFDHVKFINVPGEVFGHGAVEQAVNLVEMGNAYLSLMMQSAIENVFPSLVLEDPMKAPETITRGAGAVLPINAGGKAYYLAPPSGTMQAQAQWAREVERMVQQDTSMPEVNFGAAHQSIITGKGIAELQGAGTGTLVEHVQGTAIGAALSSWNEKAIHIGRTMFGDDTIRLYGVETANLASLNPRHFSMNIKGKQLVGSTRNEVVFMPYLDMQQKVVIGLQLAGAGLVSKQWQRENVGIPDNEAMEDEIISETIEGAVLQLLVQTITEPEQAPEVEAAAEDYIAGVAHPLTQMKAPTLPPRALGPAAPGLPPAGAPPGAPPAAGLPPPGPPPVGGAAAAETGGGPPPPPAAGAAPSEQPQPAPQGLGQQHPQQNRVILDTAIRQFQQIPQMAGRAFLVGEIVQTGETSNPVNTDITDPRDRDPIASTIPFMLQIKIVSGPPSEPFIEVTPGATPVQQGEMPTPEELGQ